MIETLKIIVQVLPLILEVMKIVEANVPESGKGNEKLEFVTGFINEAAPEIANLSSTVKRIVTLATSLFNRTGVFK